MPKNPGKFVLAAKSLLSAHHIDPEDPELHLRVVDFKLKGEILFLRLKYVEGP